MIRLEIRDATVIERDATVKGRATTFREQQAWAQMNGETRKVRVPLNREMSAYPAGAYVLDDSSFGVNQWGDLVISRVMLRSASVAPSKQAEARVAG